MRLSLAAFLLLALGCGEPDVSVYDVAKESGEPSGIASAALPAAPSVRAEGASLVWKAPAEWRAEPASGMRLASFSFEAQAGGKADISVVAFPGAAGGELANVNRWRGQLGLSPLNPAEMKARTLKVRTKAGQALLVDFIGADPKGDIPGKARLLGAILSVEERQWFFKVMGEEKAVAQAKPSFIKFLRSVSRAPNS